MPAYQILRQEEQEDETQLEIQLEKELSECVEVAQTYRNKVKVFMEEQGIWHICELDYPLREVFHGFLEGQIKPVCYTIYEKAFDRIIQHSIRNQIQEVKGKQTKLKYANQLLFLPYHPELKISSRFERAQKKADLVWDFSVEAPENMKKQVFQVLHNLIRTIQDGDQLRVQMNALRSFYQFCIDHKVEDIEMMELSQAQEFRDMLGADKKGLGKAGIIDVARKVLFIQAGEIHWKAHVWYLERFYLQPERIVPSDSIRKLSFLEVPHQRNREILKQYMRYGLGITNLSIRNLWSGFMYVRKFMVELVRSEDVCVVTEQQMDAYFRKLQERKIQAETYNKILMYIQHFYNFLQVRGYIKKSPFCIAYYMKKVMPQHHDRSVELETSREILQSLHLFPERVRLMYLHLWGIGLRISEVCTLKGNAYYAQGKDKWIQVYQNKMKNYKRIPIQESLYYVMMVYLKKYGIEENDYVFQNRRGGAYYSITFQKQMLRCCKENQIQNGEYIFRSHDYRHGIATLFYDRGVSLQGVRDYLGHTYEEMTQQYIDYIPRKLENANDKYFKQHKSLALNLTKKKGKKNGEQNLFSGSAMLPDCNNNTEKESRKEPLL